MILDEIKALTPNGESETLEFKETTGTRRESAMTVCAFLNQGGGQVLIGVMQDGTVAGQQVSERTMEELSAELQRIDPPAFPKVERVSVDGGREVIVVSTGQGVSRPYTYRGTAYRRRGNTTLSMSADEYNRMLFERMHSEQRWENPASRRMVGGRPRGGGNPADGRGSGSARSTPGACKQGTIRPAAWTWTSARRSAAAGGCGVVRRHGAA